MLRRSRPESGFRSGSTGPPPFRLPSQPGVTTTVSPEVAQFQKIEDSWSDAVNRRDQYGLELVLSPLFVDVSASGDVTTRNQQVVQVISGEDKTVYLTQKVITVRMLGDIAVANGTYTLHHKVNPARWTKRACLRMSLSACAAAGCASTRSAPCCARTRAPSKRKRPRPRSPFHIPLFSKGDKGPQ